MRGSMLAVSTAVAAAVLCVACGSGGSSPSSSGGSPTPDLSNFQGPGEDGTEYVDVEPANNLKDGQTVMVTGRGFKPNLELAFNMCKLVTRGYSDCDPTTTVQNEVKSDAQGNFPATPYKVTEHVAFPSSRNAPVDCGTSVCSVGVGDVGGLTAGSHCVGFGGACQPEPGNKPLTAFRSGPAGATAMLALAIPAAWLRRRRRVIA